MRWRQVLLGVLFLVNVFFVYRLLWSDQGLFAYLEMKKRHDALEERIQEADEKSLKLSQEIRWLKSDKAYQEKVIRWQMNFLRKNEILYLFRDNSTIQGEGGAGDERKD